MTARRTLPASFGGWGTGGIDGVSLRTNINTMSKLKVVTVTLEKTRRKSQPWTFVIDKPGAKAKETKREYYARKWTAMRGAMRQLKGYDCVAKFYTIDRTKRQAPAMKAKQSSK